MIRHGTKEVVGVTNITAMKPIKEIWVHIGGERKQIYGGTWEDPIQDGDNLTVTQVFGATQDGDNLVLE